MSQTSDRSRRDRNVRITGDSASEPRWRASSRFVPWAVVAILSLLIAASPAATQAGVGVTGRKAQLYLDPAGVDTAPCSAQAPCHSFSRALAVASPGDVIAVAPGFYGCDVLSGSKRVTFRAASNAPPWIACSSPPKFADGASLVLHDASNLTFDGIWMAGVEWDGPSPTRDIVFHNVHVTCRDGPPFVLYNGRCSASLGLGPATGFTMIGGEIGPTYTCPDSGRPQTAIYGDDITFDRVTFNLNRRCENAHTECLMIRGGNRITIKNSRFPRCNVFSIFFTCWPGNGDCSSAPAPKNVLLENNYFGSGPPYYSVEIASHMPRADNYDFRYNTATRAINWDAPAVGGSSMVGNVVLFSRGCAAGVSYHYNVFFGGDGQGCGDRTNRALRADTARLAGVDASGHLMRGSRAVGRGDPEDHPLLDIDGDPRSVGLIDAGADQTVPRALRAAPNTLLVSPVDSRMNARPLHGLSLCCDVFVFLPPQPGAAKVTFYLDDTSRQRLPARVAISPPFDLVGRRGVRALPLKVSRLTPGRHSLTAVVAYRSGRTEALTGTFVARRPRTAP